MIAHGAVLVVELMLGEHAAECGHACLGLPVRCLAFASFEFFSAHRHSGVIGLDVENIGITGLRRAFLSQPLGGGRTYAQNFALDLPFSNDHAAGFLEMKRGFLVAGFIGAFQADEAGERGSVATFQAECFIGGMVAAFFSGMIVVGALQSGAAEHALDLELLTSLADFSGLGLIDGIDLVSGFLEELADKVRSRFKNGGAQQLFEIGDKCATRLRGTEGGD